MPLKALVDGTEVQSWRYSDEDWKALDSAKKNGKVAVTLPCCDAAVIMKAGSRIKHFAHKAVPDYCNWKSESPEHEKAKFIIAQACLEAGYDADIEVSGPDFQADVLATKNGAEIAFEVQLSRQTLDTTKERREKFRQAGIKDIWLFRKYPAGSDGRTPRFCLLATDDEPFSVKRASGNIPLDEFVKQILLAEDQGSYEASDDQDVELADSGQVLDPWRFALRFLLVILIVAAIYGLLKVLFRPKKKYVRYVVRKR